MIPFINRFHGHSSLNYVYRNGQVTHSRIFTVKTIENPNRNDSRVAVIISKKVLKSAVKRNRVRRQVYEYVQKMLPKLGKVYDISIIVLSGETYSMPQKDIFKELDQVFSQTSLVKNK